MLPVVTTTWWKHSTPHGTRAHERPGLSSQPLTMGEHNQEVLSRAGYTDEAISDLAQRNIIVSS